SSSVMMRSREPSDGSPHSSGSAPSCSASRSSPRPPAQFHLTAGRIAPIGAVAGCVTLQRAERVLVVAAVLVGAIVSLVLGFALHVIVRLIQEPDKPVDLVPGFLAKSPY